MGSCNPQGTLGTSSACGSGRSSEYFWALPVGPGHLRLCKGPVPLLNTEDTPSSQMPISSVLWHAMSLLRQWWLIPVVSMDVTVLVIDITGPGGTDSRVLFRLPQCECSRKPESEASEHTVGGRRRERPPWRTSDHVVPPAQREGWQPAVCQVLVDKCREASHPKAHHLPAALPWPAEARMHLHTDAG